MSDQPEKLENPGSAVAYLMMGIMAGLCLDITAKWLLQDYALVQFVFLRSVFGLACLLLVISRFDSIASLKTQRLGWHLLRTGLAACAMFGFFLWIIQNAFGQRHDRGIHRAFDGDSSVGAVPRRAGGVATLVGGCYGFCWRAGGATAGVR